MTKRESEKYNVVLVRENLKKIDPSLKLQGYGRKWHAKIDDEEIKLPSTIGGVIYDKPLYSFSGNLAKARGEGESPEEIYRALTVPARDFRQGSGLEGAARGMSLLVFVGLALFVFSGTDFMTGFVVSGASSGAGVKILEILLLAVLGFGVFKIFK